MSQTEQAVEQIAEENAVAGGQLLGSFRLPFNFDRSKTSTRTITIPFTPPRGTAVSHIFLQGFNVMYVGEDYEVENLQVSLRIQGTNALCTATLRDRNGGDNGREWQGSVTGLLLYFGKA